MERQKKAVYGLLFLSPLLAELVSGSSPPIEWLSPNVLGLLALYGCGALLIRDAVIRSDKGWASLLLLGCAYGVYEEGIVVSSWFNPNWPDISSTYGRVGDVGWMWAANLTVYHAVVSIAIPIFLVDVMFPEFKGKRLLSDKATRWCLFFFALCLPVYALAFSYFHGPEQLIAPVIGLFFVDAARRVPKDFLRPLGAVAPTRVWRFALVGFLWMMWIFLFPALAEGGGVYFGITIAVLLFSSIAVLLALRGALHPSNAERCVFAFVAGAFGFIAMVGFFYGMFNPAAGPGMVAVGPVAVGWLAWTYRRTLPRWRGAGAPVVVVHPAAAP